MTRVARFVAALSVTVLATTTVASGASARPAGDIPGPITVSSPNPVTNVGPFSPVAGGFVPITPKRVLDSRSGPKLAAFGADGRTSFTVVDPSDPTIPADQVGAVSLNVTVVDGDTAGYLMVWDASTAWPGTSVLNYAARDVTANTVTVRVAANALVSYMVSSPAHLIVDVTGWYTKQGAAPVSGGGFVPVVPRRTFDSRPTGKVAAFSPRRVDFPAALVPAAGVTAVVMNVVSTGADGEGWASFYPTGTAPPGTSNLNYSRGQDIANQIIVKSGTNNAVSFFVSTRTNILVDLVGFYTAGVAGAGGFVPMTPIRIMDTRSAFGNYGYDPVNDALQLIIGGSNNVPRFANAISANVTAVGAHSPGYLTLWPDSQARPNSSNLNYRAGQVIANGATIGLGALKGMAMYTSSDPYLIVDLTGYFTSPYLAAA
jgi:hypothetical protein